MKKLLLTVLSKVFWSSMLVLFIFVLGLAATKEPTGFICWLFVLTLFLTFNHKAKTIR